MKSIRNVFALFAAVLAILAFWLAPNINQAKDAEYVRRYEDVDLLSKTPVVVDTTSKARGKKQSVKDAKPVKEEKVYKEERIRSRDKLSKITPAKFSRAMQFEEVSLLSDTLVLADTTTVAP